MWMKVKHLAVLEEESHAVHVDLEDASFSSLHVLDGKLPAQIGQRLPQAVTADGVVHGTFDAIVELLTFGRVIFV